eukprot:3909804-Amphidinium_carterae.1
MLVCQQPPPARCQWMGLVHHLPLLQKRPSRVATHIGAVQQWARVSQSRGSRRKAAVLRVEWACALGEVKVASKR